jgi:RNA polymerase sigma-70 factor (ECF subfamily)
MDRRWQESFIASVVADHGRQLIKFFVSRLRDSSEAHDFAQEVYLRLLRLERPDLIRSPEAYLFTVAANIVREHAIKRSMRPLQVSLEDTPTNDLSSDSALVELVTPEDAAHQAHRVRELEGILAGLPPKARAALIWHRRDGKTYNEIAASLGISRNMVKKYLSRAVAACRKARDEGNAGGQGAPR